MRLLNFLRPRPWSLEGLELPWERGSSVFEKVRDTEGACGLPDELPPDGTKIWFSAGALDGILGHHMGASDEDSLEIKIEQILKSLGKVLSEPSTGNLQKLNADVIADSMLPIADALQNRILETYLPKHEQRLRDIGRLFLLKADHREATKFGILLVAVSGNESDVNSFETLALHDEFTLYAGLAAAKFSHDQVRLLWKLAKRVKGWGKIQLVERLDGVSDPEVKSWMLRGGFRNKIMDTYLTAICARTGELHKELAKESVDQELLDNAAAIFEGLLDFGPAETIDDYQHAQEAVEHYLRILENTRPLGMKHLVCTANLLRFLEGEGWESRFSLGWSGDARDRLTAKCKEIIARPEWKQQVEAGLATLDGEVFNEADAAAKVIGIETREFHYERVRRNPKDIYSWHRLLSATDETQLDDVLQFAYSVLPLDEIAKGPDIKAFIVGEGNEFHSILDSLTQELRRFPGRGWRFIRAALRCPGTLTRNMALKTLDEWPKETWPSEARDLLRKAISEEPDPDIKRRLEEMAASFSSDTR